MLGLLSAKKGRGDSWRPHGQPCRGVLQLPVHKFGVLRYPYFSTPTGAPGPGPYTVPSVVGPGPNSARARVAWVALLLNSVPVAPSLGGACLSRRRGGEALDGEVLIAVVDAPSSSSNEPEEEQLLRKLASLYRARQAKVERQEALVAKAGAAMEKRAAELRELNQQAAQSLAEERRLLGEARTAFILEKAEAEEQQRLAAAELSVRESELVQKTASLASHEEEVAAREQALGGDLKKAQDAAAAAETAKKELEARVAQLDTNLKAKGEDLAALQQEREK